MADINLPCLIIGLLYFLEKGIEICSQPKPYYEYYYSIGPDFPYPSALLLILPDGAVFSVFYKISCYLFFTLQRGPAIIVTFGEQFSLSETTAINGIFVI